MAVIHKGKNGLESKIKARRRARWKKLLILCLSYLALWLLLRGDSFWDWLGNVFAQGVALISERLSAKGTISDDGSLLYALYQLCLRLSVGVFKVQPLFTYGIPVAAAWHLIRTFRKKDPQLGILEAGRASEEKALKMLSILPDDYHLFTNLNIPYQGKVSETDVICVGPGGVSIVEVKGYKGNLLGSWEDEKLSRIKKRQGKTDAIYNPLKQVNTHVYRLSGYLREQGQKVWVTGLVYFTMPELDLSGVCGDGSNVYTEEKTGDLRCRLQNSDSPLLQTQVQRIADLLDALPEENGEEN